MDQEKIGKFITSKRKEKNLTQSELAEILGVTDRAVSNWENGKNMPDLSLFKPLCEILNISINELMSGEKLNNKEYTEKLEENIIKTKSIRKLLVVSSGNLMILIFLIHLMIKYREPSKKKEGKTNEYQLLRVDLG